MRERENICNYLDMPLQHGSTVILKHMRRGTTREKQEELIQTIREKVPGIALRTTLLAGYPGETEADFEEMRGFVERSRFERLGVFTYSHEENTHAHNFEDNVPEEVKQERANEIMAVQEQISYDINQTRIGNTYRVLIDRKESGNFIGRTEYDSPEVDNEVIVTSDTNHLRIGDFANVKITDATEFDLHGVPIL